MDDIVSLIHDPKFGIIFTNGEPWKDQRKTLVSLLKKTGFQKSYLESVIEQVWPQLKESLTKSPSMVVEVTEPMESATWCPMFHALVGYPFSLAQFDGF